MNKIIMIMQKAQTVIKCLNLRVLFLILPIFNFGQNTLKGIYSNLNSLQEQYNYYKFEKEGTFEYHSGASLGDDTYANGDYIIKNDSLILHYNESKPLRIGYHISEVWKNNSDSIVINYNIYSLETESIPFVNIIYKDSTTKSGFNGGVTDKEGKVLLIFKKNNENLKISFSNVGFKEYEMLVDMKYNYNIDVFLLKQGLGIPIKNQTDCFKIVEMTKGFFIVLDENNRKIKWVKR